MALSEKIKTIDEKMEKTKTQYSLGRLTAKISTLSSRNICKSDFLNG